MIVFKILNQHIRVKIDVPLSSSRIARTDDGGGLNTFYVDRDSVGASTVRVLAHRQLEP